MATSFKCVKGKAWKGYISLISQANTMLTKVNPTIAAGDFQISKDGGAFANLATLPSANPAGGRAVMIDLSATETTADNIVIQCVDAAGAEWCDVLICIETKEQAIPNLHFVMRDTSGNPATGKTVTAQRVLDSGSFGAGTIGTITEIANGLYRVNLPLADLNAADNVTLMFTATGCMPSMLTLMSAY